MSSSRLSTCACTETSSAETASSSTSTRGSTASARAIATRCRCPPDSRRGSASPSRAPSPTWSSSSATRRGAGGPVEAGVQAQHPVDAVADPDPRVEREVRVLEDDLDRAGPRQRAARPRAEVEGLAADDGSTRCRGPRVRRASARSWSCPTRTPRPARRRHRRQGERHPVDGLDDRVAHARRSCAGRVTSSSGPCVAHRPHLLVGRPGRPARRRARADRQAPDRVSVRGRPAAAPRRRRGPRRRTRTGPRTQQPTGLLEQAERRARDRHQATVLPGQVGRRGQQPGRVGVRGRAEHRRPPARSRRSGRRT